jgi:hypothetical protein
MDIKSMILNGTPEQKKEAFRFLMKDPEFKQYLKMFVFDAITPAQFEMIKRLRI